MQRPCHENWSGKSYLLIYGKLREIVTEDVMWDVTEGFPFGGTYKGLDNVLHNFYGRVLPRLDKLWH
jgi:hypothetical protein